MERYDLSGKHIYPVSQSASMDESQYAQSVAFIKACAEGAVVDEGIFPRMMQKSALMLQIPY